MYDCAWSPQHPALFAAVDGTGRLDLWNLNKDTEVASASVTVEGGAALNRVTWTQSGLHVAAGDDCGKIWVYDVGEQLAVPQPDEWNKFAHTLQVTQHHNPLCIVSVSQDGDFFQSFQTYFILIQNAVPSWYF